MIYNDHSKLKGQHATLSPSSVTWIRYDNDKLQEKLSQNYYSSLRVQMGTALHEFAASNIDIRQKLSSNKKHLIQMIRVFLKAKEHSNAMIDFANSLPDEVYTTLVDYVNDSISYRMDTEQILFYSYNCFGTADAISFKNNVLRISDLKTGDYPAHMEQLLIYAALFCLEYNFKPSDIKIELRLYQNGVTIEHEASVEEVVPVMDRIVTADKILSNVKEGD